MYNSVNNESLNNYPYDSNSREEIKVYTDFFLKLSNLLQSKESYLSLINTLDRPYIDLSSSYPLFIGLSYEGEEFYQVAGGVVTNADYMIPSNNILPLNEVKALCSDLMARLIYYGDEIFLYDFLNEIFEEKEEIIEALKIAISDNEEACKDFVNEALIHAVRRGDVMFAETLLEFGADIDYLTKGSRKSVLAIAVQKSKLDMVKLLIENGADIELGKEKGKGPLFFAIEGCKDEIFDILLRRGCDINNRSNKNGNPPLMSAIMSDNMYALSRLVSYGANIYLENFDNDNPKSIAVKEDNLKIVNFIRSIEEKHSLAKKYIYEGNLKDLKLLLNKNPFLSDSPINKKGENLLDFAIKNSKKKFVKYFGKLGVKSTFNTSLSNLRKSNEQSYNKYRLINTPFNNLLSSKPLNPSNVFEGLVFNSEEGVSSSANCLKSERVVTFGNLSVKEHKTRYATPANRLTGNTPKSNKNIFMRLAVDSNKNKSFGQSF